MKPIKGLSLLLTGLLLAGLAGMAQGVEHAVKRLRYPESIELKALDTRPGP